MHDFGRERVNGQLADAFWKRLLLMNIYEIISIMNCLIVRNLPKFSKCRKPELLPKLCAGRIGILTKLMDAAES